MENDNGQGFEIDLDERRTPWNAHLVLPTDAYEQLAPMFEVEIMQGLTSYDKHGRIVLDLNLSYEKLQQLKRIVNRSINYSIIKAYPLYGN